MSLIQELKEDTGLTIQQIADFAGISRSLLSMAESGRRDIRTRPT
jgi:transcriptional regulator with XRE-family HTH domain